MNASEFQTIVHNGLIVLPKDQQSWNGKKIRVILLDETELSALADQTAFPEIDFFDLAEIWENREINQEALRKKGWRNNQS